MLTVRYHQGLKMFIQRAKEVGHGTRSKRAAFLPSVSRRRAFSLPWRSRTELLGAVPGETCVFRSQTDLLYSSQGDVYEPRLFQLNDLDENVKKRSLMRAKELAGKSETSSQ